MKEIETNVTILLELSLPNIIKILNDCNGISGDSIKQVLLQLSDCTPKLVLSDQNEWVPQDILFPNDPVCTVESYKNVQMRSINLFSNHEALADEEDEDMTNL